MRSSHQLVPSVMVVHGLGTEDSVCHLAAWGPCLPSGAAPRGWLTGDPSSARPAQRGQFPGEVPSRLSWTDSIAIALDRRPQAAKVARPAQRVMNCALQPLGWPSPGSQSRQRLCGVCPAPASPKCPSPHGGRDRRVTPKGRSGREVHASRVMWDP